MKVLKRYKMYEALLDKNNEIELKLSILRLKTLLIATMSHTLLT